MDDESNPSLIMRVITAQGPTQLLSAIAILKYQLCTQGTSPVQDILVIGGLFSEHYIELINATKIIASQWSFCQTIVLGINLSLTSSNPSSKFPGTSDLKHLEAADAIYVCRNWQPFNEAMIDLCRNADVICYGDGFGTLDALLPGPDDDSLQRRRKRLNRIVLHSPPDFSAFKYPLDSIVGILDIVPASYLLNVLEASSLLFPCIEDLLPRDTLITRQHLVLVALSNLSESGWIRPHPFFSKLSQVAYLLKNLLRRLFSSWDLSAAEKHSSILLVPLFQLISSREVRMYEEYLLRYLDRSAQIFLKAHPRQSYNQAEFLAERLRRRGFNVISSSIKFSVVPVELIIGFQSVNTFFAMGSTSAHSVRFSPRCSDLEVYEQIDLDIRRKYLASFALPLE